MALPLRYNIRSVVARPGTTLVSVGLIALVIGTFSYLQAVTNSALATVGGTGDPNTLIVLNEGAETETVSGISKESLDKLQLTPGIVRGPQDVAMSAEVVAISSAVRKGIAEDVNEDDVSVNVCVRGVDFDAANFTRHGRVKLIAGRVFAPGQDEVIVGSAVRQGFRRHDIGDIVQVGSRGMRDFTVVGVFSTGGTAADSEIWGYVETVRDVYARNRYASVRLIVPDGESARAALDYVNGTGVELNGKTESSYFSELGTNQTATRVLTFAMIIVLGIAAAFAVANTMYSAVAGRTGEIGMLRAIGFGRSSILAAFVIEGVLITVAGGALGCLLSFVCNGMQRSLLASTFTTVTYSLSITPTIVVVSMAVALCIGFAGSIMPAWRAARMDVVKTLREA